MKKSLGLVILLWMGLILAVPAFCAYHHEGETDSLNFLAVYPDKAGSKLDRCAVCHSGGQYEKRKGVFVSLGSCQWCHYSYGYDGSGNIVDTLNDYGKDYFVNGRNENAIKSIENKDSDGDGYTNGVEIAAVRYPGNAGDNPNTITAPSKVYTKAQLEAMPQHTQFLLMNTSRSGDFYGEYSGVVMETLLADAGVAPTATGITVYAPDGFSTYHPMDYDPDPSLYHVRGDYPEAVYHYSPEADTALNPVDGWCDYSAPSCQGRHDGDLIAVDGGLKMILAIKRDGAYMDAGVLDASNKLDGEGPFRVVPPQKVSSAPDQSSTASNQNVLWPYNSTWDHNAGFSSRTATIIKVEPLPPGTTDIDYLEAGWNFVDEGKIIVYGAIAGNVVATVNNELKMTIEPIKLAGNMYGATLALYNNPVDPTGLYWKLSSAKMSTGNGVVEYAQIDETNGIQIPRLQYGQANYRVFLEYYSNSADPTGLYWKLCTIDPL